MYLSFIYKISIILSLLNIVTLHFTMYILTILTCFLKMYTIYFFLNVTWSKYLLHKKKWYFSFKNVKRDMKTRLFKETRLFK